MSALADASPPTTLSPHQRQWVQTPPQPAHASGHIVFTRQLWQRNMPDGSHPTEDAVLNKSHAQETRSSSSHHLPTAPSRRASSSTTVSASSRSHRRSSSPSGGDFAAAPLTPEESPPFSRTTRKRAAGIVEADDHDHDLPDASPVHTRSDSGDLHVCICQPEPKIPRPRNAFILYRQNQQAQVVAQNPGLANPEISKIIGEQWQNLPPEIKNRWKALAEEEKLRHQQQYPSYRYQPKRSNRRGSLSLEPSSGVEKPRCHKCGGKSILTPSTPYTASNSPATAHTPGSLVTPVTRTLPILRDLSLQSPAARKGGRFLGSTMSSYHDERDDVGPLSPELKRRRYNNNDPDLPASMASRPLPPRYVAAPPPGPHSGPGTPFPFSQPPAPHPYPPAAAAHARRESLPGLRGVVSPPGPMAPPPRPGPGYAQHRMSQGHVGPHDRSLTLPPLQTSGAGVAPSPMTATSSVKSAKESIMTLDFWYKINVLGKVAPPAPVHKSAPRGPLVAIEGDSAEAVKALGVWLSDTLGKGDDLSVKLLDGPAVVSEGSKQQVMAQYHRVAADWLLKSSDITGSLMMKTASPTDSVMVDASSSSSSQAKGRAPIDENYDDSDESPSTSNRASPDRVVARADDLPPHSKECRSDDAGKMDVDATTRQTPHSHQGSHAAAAAISAKPVGIIANYSLYASNFFACHIPIESYAQYSPKDHWEWTATQWRGIVSPDLTIYIKDSATADSGGKATVEILEPGNLFVVKRSNAAGSSTGSNAGSNAEESKDVLEIEPPTLRRLGFEVSEWVRGFGET